MILSERARGAGWHLDRDGRLRRLFSAGWQAATPGSLRWRQLVAGTGPQELYRHEAGLVLDRKDATGPPVARDHRKPSATRGRRPNGTKPKPFKPKPLGPVPALLGHERNDQPHEVTIRSDVRRAILDAILVNRAPLGRGYEIAGYLFGKYSGYRSRRLVEIVTATLATQESRYHGALLDQGSAAAARREVAQQRANHREPWLFDVDLVGTWHTHPQRSDVHPYDRHELFVPSGQDRRAALADIKREKLELHVDLIAIPAAIRGERLSWDAHELGAWLTQVEWDGRAVTRPMRIAD